MAFGLMILPDGGLPLEWYCNAHLCVPDRKTNQRWVIGVFLFSLQIDGGEGLWLP